MRFADKNKWLETVLLVFALVVIALVFWPGLYGSFIFDDYPIFAENPNAHITGWHWNEWKEMLDWSASHIQRPLAMLSYAINSALGSGTFGFKATNLFIHLLNAVLVFLFTKKLLNSAWRRLKKNDPPEKTNYSYWALGISIAWAVHPLQVSTVMYVVQRMELLGFTFVLLALLAYWHARKMELQEKRAWPFLLLCLVLTCVGYFAKETTVLVPAYALLLELTILRFSSFNEKNARYWKIFYGSGCIAAAAVLIFYILPHYGNAAAYAGREFNVSERELTQLRILPMYLYWIILPHADNLLFYYDNYAISTGLLNPVTTLIGGATILCLLWISFAFRHRRPLLSIGIGWFFVAHLLTSSPIPLELVFEHRNYPALFGVVLALSDLLFILTQRTKSRTPLLIAGVLIANLAFLCCMRAAVWGNPLQLAINLADMNPGSSRAALDLARRYMNMSGGDSDSPMFSMSVQQLKRATKLSSPSPLPEEALLLIAAEHPDMDAKPWWESLQNKLKNRPLVADTYLALHKLMDQRVNGAIHIDAKELACSYEMIIARLPKRQSLHVEYAELAGAALNDPNLAIEQWDIALDQESDVPGYSRQLAGYLVSKQRYQEAQAVISKAWHLQPSLTNDGTLNMLNEKSQSALKR